MRIHNGVAQLLALAAFTVAFFVVPAFRQGMLVYLAFIAYLALCISAGVWAAGTMFGDDARVWGAIGGFLGAFFILFTWIIPKPKSE